MKQVVVVMANTEAVRLKIDAVRQPNKQHFLKSQLNWVPFKTIDLKVGERNVVACLMQVGGQSAVFR